MCKEGKVFSWEGYQYNDQNNKPFIEFHIDNHPSLSTLAEIHPFGGNLSVCKPSNSKPLIILGQDEAIYKQFSFWSKYWSGPSAEVPPMSKNDDQWLMGSAFACREFGFGYDLTPSEFKIVNQYKRNKSYWDEKATIREK